MTTRVRARVLTADHHNLRARLVMPDGTKISGVLEDSLIGETHVDLVIGGVKLTVAAGTLVELERAG